jgi:large subunit ribosomal protein L13
MAEKLKKAKKTIERNWYLINAEHQVLGKIATKIATILQGKHKVMYMPNIDCGDFVIVTNAAKVTLTGRKVDQKVYIHHTGYVGSLKTVKFKDLIKQNPEMVIQKAVFGMLPKNKLRNERLKRLRIYPGIPENKFTQKITELEIK